MVVRRGSPKGSPGYEFLTKVYGEKDRSLWSRYATDLYLRLRKVAEEGGWLPKLRFLLYEQLVTEAEAERLGDLAGILGGRDQVRHA